MENLGKERINKQEGEFKKKEEFRETEIKTLTSEKYFDELDKLESGNLQFKELIQAFQEKQKIIEEWKDRLIEAVEKGEIDDPYAPGKKLNPKEILTKIKKPEGSRIHPSDEGRIHSWVEQINKFGKDYNLDFEVSPETSPEQISREIEKAYHARLWELQNRLDE